MNEAFDYINSIPKFNRKSSLDNTREMLRRLGDPQDFMKVIHVAGTNGKGSTCAFIEKVIRDRGFVTGLFTSPHLIVMNERIAVSGKMISDEDFMKIYGILRKISEDMVRDGFVHPSFFEFLFGMAMEFFAEKGVEYAVLETGLGGRLDATNALGSVLASVITSISLDHTDILGETIEKIAFEKAGIIKEGGKVIYFDNKDSAAEVIADRAVKLGATAIPVSRDMIRIRRSSALPGGPGTYGDHAKSLQSHKNIDFSLSNEYYDNVAFSVSLRGDYQAENAALALTTLAACDLLPDYESLYASIEGTDWQGRMQEIATGVIIDGGHNEDGITRFLQSVTEDGAILVYSAVKDKHYERIIPILVGSGRFDDVVIFRLKDERGLDTDIMKEYFMREPVRLHIVDNACDAMKKALDIRGHMSADTCDVHAAQAGITPMIYCVGSLYMVGEIMASADKWKGGN